MPITPTDRLWIDDKLRWLFEQFGYETFFKNDWVRTALEYFPYKLKMDDAYPLQVLMEKICMRMQIDSGQVNLRVLMNPDSHGIPFAVGYYDEVLDFESGKVSYQIILHLMPRSDKESILYALAHSLTYIKLLGENRISAADQDYNYLTDLCMLFWGFGIIGANQAFTIQKGYFAENPGMSFTTVNRNGYLPVEMWAYALSLCSKLKGIPTSGFLSFLNKEVKQQLKASDNWFSRHPLPYSGEDFQAEGIPADDLGRKLLPEATQRKFQLLDQAIENEAFPQVWLDRARLNKRYGLLSPALRDLAHLRERGQLKDHVQLEKAQIAIDLGLWQEAYDQLNSLSAEANAWTASIYLKASFYWLTHQMEEAEAMLNQVLAREPKHAKANWSKGSICFWQKEKEKALEHFDIAIQKDPLQALFWTYRAKIHILKGDLKKALEDIHTAMGLQPSLAEAYVGRGVIRRKQKRFDAALSDFKTALRLDYDNKYASWHQSIIPYLITEEIWIPVGSFETLEDAYDYRMQLRALGIKHRFGDEPMLNMTASTHIGKWLYVREDRVEEAMDILTEGWW